MLMSVTSRFYSDRADECANEAANSPLENVRDRCLRSEAAWRAMANRLIRAERMRDQQVAEKAARTEEIEA
jgi:hypothetical protein